MSCRKTKSDGIKKSVALNSERYSEALLKLIAACLEMPVCSYCSQNDKDSFEVSSENSSRYALYKQHNQPRCDRRPLTTAQLRALSSSHIKVEVELDSAEAELKAAAAKVRRLRQQKKI
jgi:hypothetical protein